MTLQDLVDLASHIAHPEKVRLYVKEHDEAYDEAVCVDEDYTLTALGGAQGLGLFLEY